MADYQPPSRMTGRDILGRRNSRLQYIMKYKEVEPLVNKEIFKQIWSAWEKIKTPAVDYCTYRDVAKELKIPVGRLMQYLKGMHEQNPYSIRFNVNRMGDNVYFKLLKQTKEDLIMKFRCERWAVIDKETGKELGTLGWYTNSSKEEVLEHAKNNGIKIEKGEDIKVMEEC